MSGTSSQCQFDAVTAILTQETDHVGILLVRHELGRTGEEEGKFESVGSSHMSDQRDKR